MPLTRLQRFKLSFDFRLAFHGLVPLVPALCKEALGVRIAHFMVRKGLAGVVQCDLRPVCRG